ncbi:hypothetical protein [Streptomyces vastus]
MPTVIRRIAHPDGSVVIIGGKNREQHPPNLHACLLSQALGGPVEDLRGSVVFAGVTPSDRLISLPDAVLAEAHKTCIGTTSLTASRNTNERDNL